MIAIVDYGVGNLFSLASSLKFLGVPVQVASDEKGLTAADKIILPGVGAFSDAMSRLQDTGLATLLLEQAGEGKPILGICLGMQLLFDRSLEYGEYEGLGLIPGTIRSIEADLPEEYRALKVPHIGWNRLSIEKKDPIFAYFREGECVYYVHSYYATECKSAILGFSEYGIRIPGVVRRGNIYGTQFHPEKSGTTGLSLLRAFCLMQKGVKDEHLPSD